MADAGSVVNSAYFKQKLAEKLSVGNHKTYCWQPPVSRLRPVLSWWVAGASVFP
ncbi:hypothetical protein [Paenibacillus chitinolyticus]|uniref:hypothetical protein n=1 Tax=Paenibacillus chitinolyticus TaxID=79263 RepID=UPI0036712D82